MMLLFRRMLLVLPLSLVLLALALAAGYVRTTSDVPYMGEHYLNYNYVKSGIFDPAHPQGLLFSKIDSGTQLGSCDILLL
jgi:hypothetical protein